MDRAYSGGMTENEKKPDLPPDAPASADMMYEGGGSVPHPDDDTSATSSKGEPRRQTGGENAGSMTLLARIRKGWRGPKDELPIERKSQFWTLTALWLLFALAAYVVWSALGFAD